MLQKAWLVLGLIFNVNLVFSASAAPKKAVSYRVQFFPESCVAFDDLLSVISMRVTDGKVVNYANDEDGCSVRKKDLLWVKSLRDQKLLKSATITTFKNPETDVIEYWLYLRLKDTSSEDVV